MSRAELADAYDANTVCDLWMTNRRLYGVRKLWHAANTRARANNILTEGGLIVGRRRRPAIGTQVERQSHLLTGIFLPQRGSFEVRFGLLRELAGLPVLLLQSITWDQGGAWKHCAATTGFKNLTCY